MPSFQYISECYTEWLWLQSSVYIIIILNVYECHPECLQMLSTMFTNVIHNVYKCYPQSLEMLSRIFTISEMLSRIFTNSVLFALHPANISYYKSVVIYINTSKLNWYCLLNAGFVQSTRGLQYRQSTVMWYYCTLWKS